MICYIIIQYITLHCDSLWYVIICYDTLRYVVIRHSLDKYSLLWCRVRRGDIVSHTYQHQHHLTLHWYATLASKICFSRSLSSWMQARQASVQSTGVYVFWYFSPLICIVICMLVCMCVSVCACVCLCVCVHMLYDKPLSHLYTPLPPAAMHTAAQRFF